MRFATAIHQIQNLRAYHAGDKLVVEVDIVLSAATPLKDSHDLSEVLTYFLESVPIVDRAFVCPCGLHELQRPDPHAQSDLKVDLGSVKRGSFPRLVRCPLQQQLHATVTGA